jgi:radical SAM superfamily enzyme YgiQ (UPF0313 family)
MDSDQFYAAPTTTATLKAYYQHYGKNTEQQNIHLVHFKDSEDVIRWQEEWQSSIINTAKQALDKGLAPIIGLSFYTWNAADFLSLIASVKKSLPDILIIVGGPHVQQAEDYLGEDPIDIIVLGEGERTFTDILDVNNNDFSNIHGIAYLNAHGDIVKTPERERIKDLNEIPSPLSAMQLIDDDGKPIYPSISYETSRGCPFKCAFCEWGTGAIGTKMNQFSMERVKSDWEIIVKAGIENIWLADSNFGALKEDLEKTQLICDLKNQYGVPRTFATSWSKKHSPRVQEMVLLLNQNGLLPHYQLALQTLTPLALELSNRTNMAANKYQPIAKEMAKAGVPIAAELIWGLPGDNLKDFETNLDTLLATFPNINIFAYTLLPGTEFYEKRHEYKIEAIPVAGYGKAKGEYVIGSHTFSKEEGTEGYFLITAHIILIHGHLIPLSTRFLALEGSIPVSTLLRKVLYALLESVQLQLSDIDFTNKIAIYENRNRIYISLINQFETTFSIIEKTMFEWLKDHKANTQLINKHKAHLQTDKILSPMSGQKSLANYHFNFNIKAIYSALEAMELPEESSYTHAATIGVETPGGVGEVLKGPEGGNWLKGRIIDAQQNLAMDVS